MSSFRVVPLPSGVWSIQDQDSGETFHPVIGPAAEAEALYVRQLRLEQRFQEEGELTLWDVGLGGAANPIAVLRALSNKRGRVRILSFDRTDEPLKCALEHAEPLVYPQGWEAVLKALFEDRRARVRRQGLEIDWTFEQVDFSSAIHRVMAEAWDKPGAILFDAFSPARNPEMWTLPLFNRMRELVGKTPCAMPTYSRSTMLRATWLCAGFWVGRGCATGEKEETTVAATSPALLDELLDRSWLERCRRSTSAEPMVEPVYRQRPLSAESMNRLASHPQFLEQNI